MRISKRKLRKLDRPKALSPELTESLIKEGLELAREGRNLLVHEQGSNAPNYGVLVVHESASSHLPKTGESLFPLKPGWSGLIFRADGQMLARTQGRVAAIVMVGARREVVILESGAN